MRRVPARLIKTAALLLLTLPARAGWFGINSNSTQIHAHSGATDGGNTLNPLSVTVQQLASPGLEVLVSSQSFTAISSITFSGLVDSTTYRMEWHLTQSGTPGNFRMQVNGLSTNLACVGLNIFTQNSTATQGTCDLDDDSHTPTGAISDGEAVFTTQYGNGNLTIVRSVNVDRYASNNLTETNGLFYMNPGNDISSVTITGYSGNPTFNGYVYLYKEIPPAGWNLAGGTNIGANLPIHQHSSATDGGTYLAPSSMTVSGASNFGGTTNLTSGSYYPWSLNISSQVLVRGNGGGPSGYFAYDDLLGADSKAWGLDDRSGKVTLELFNDAWTAITPIMQATRSGMTVTQVAFPNGNVLFGAAASSVTYNASQGSLSFSLGNSFSSGPSKIESLSDNGFTLHGAIGTSARQFTLMDSGGGSRFLDVDNSGNLNLLGAGSGNVTVKAGSNIVYRCATAGALPAGALTITSGSCGTTTDTGLRVP